MKLLGGALALVVVIVAVILIVATSGSDDLPAPRDPRASIPFIDPSRGIGLRRLEDWPTNERRGVIRVRSPDRKAVVVVSSPGPARDYRLVLRDAVDVIRSEFRRVRVLGGGPRRLSGLPARDVVLKAVSRRGDDLRIILTAARGRRRAYLAQVFTAADITTQRALETRGVIGSLTLTR